MRFESYLLKFILLFMYMFVFACATISAYDNPCAARQIFNRSVICVCNDTYCDTITRLKPSRGIYVAYTSSKAGARFKKTSGPILKSNATGPLILTLHPDVKYQKIKGFGAAVTDSASINWLSLKTAQLRQRLIDSYFSDLGIQYTFLRVPIGGTDFSTHKYGLNELPPDDMQLRNFSLAYEDYNYKIPMIKSAFAASRRPVSILGTTWAPPSWFTEKSNYTTCGRIKMKYYQTYAEYHLKYDLGPWITQLAKSARARNAEGAKRFIEHYEAQGIPIWGITTSNEPANGFLPLTRFNCLTWTAHHMGLWINHFLGPRIRGSKYRNVKILGIDDQRMHIPLWFIEMLEEYPGLIHFLDGVAVHDYSNMFAPPELLKLISDSHPDKFIMATEFCEGAMPTQELKVDLGAWDRAVSYITNIISDLKYNSVGWLDWNICLNEEGGPTWNENYVDSPIIVAPEKGEFYKQPTFYAMGHVAKFVPPGAVRINTVEIKYETTVERPHPLLMTKPEPVTYVAFLTPDDTIVVVINNSGPATEIQIQLSDDLVTLNVEADAIVTVEFMKKP